jgi:transcriptional regulator with XRE-family HTH domain
VRHRRDEIDLSVLGFAKRHDCFAALISDIELGRPHPSEKVLAETANVLDVRRKELQLMDVSP